MDGVESGVNEIVFLAVKRRNHIFFVAVDAKVVNGAFKLEIGVIHMLDSSYLTIGQLVAACNGVQHRLRAVAHFVYERGNAFGHLHIYGQTL